MVLFNSILFSCISNSLQMILQVLSALTAGLLTICSGKMFLFFKRFAISRASVMPFWFNVRSKSLKFWLVQSDFACLTISSFFIKYWYSALLLKFNLLVSQIKKAIYYKV